MAKIYANKDDVKRVYNKEDGQIRFEKKYYKIHNYLLTFKEFPTVLIPIIMDYVNDLYVVEYKNIINSSLRPGINIIQITKNYNDAIFNEFGSEENIRCVIYVRRDSLNIESRRNIFKTHDDRTNGSNCMNYYYPIHFFDYLMKKYYNKENYISDTFWTYYMKNGEYYSDNSNIAVVRKIHDYKTLTNIIVIFKIISKIVIKMHKKN